MNEYNIVSVSGGKDSSALLCLAKEQQPKNLLAVFCDTGHEQQQTYDYVRYLESALGIPIRWVKADFSAQINSKRERLEAVVHGLQSKRPAPFRTLCRQEIRLLICVSGKADFRRQRRVSAPKN